MAYLGAQPNKTLTKTTSQSFNGTGSATVFTLNRAVNTEEELEVFVENVQQEPGSGKSYTASGTTLTFDEAPPSGTGNIYVIYRGQAEVTTRLEHDANSALAATDGTFTGDLTVDTNTLYVDSTNNEVGIGTLTPGGSLEIYKAGTSEVLIGTDNGGTAQLSLYENNDGTKEGLLKYDGTNNRLHLATSGNANALVISRDSGNVGIGGAPDDSKLHVKTSAVNSSVDNVADEFVIENNGACGMTILSANNDSGFILFGDPDYNAPAGIRYEHANNAFSFRTNSAWDRMRIDSAGRVTIPNQPAFRAGVNGNYTHGSGNAIQFNDVGTGGEFFNQGNHLATSGNYRFTAPVSGVYHFHCCIIWMGISNGVGMEDSLRFNVNGSVRSYSERRAYYVASTTGNSGYYTDFLSDTFRLDANDYVFVQGERSEVIHGNQQYSRWSGFLIG